MTTAGTSVGVSVIVCAYTLDRWDDLVGALTSARSQVPAPDEVILVVDHAPDLLARALAEFPDVHVVASDGPPGLSGARNTGVSLARGEIVAFLDDDATAEPGWLQALTAPYADAGVVGSGGWAEPNWDDGRPGWFPEEFDWVVGCSYRGSPRQMRTVRNPLGCNMSFRRSVFESVGDFRHEVGRVGQLPAGCEETELCIRVRQRLPGTRIVLVPAARVRHRVRSGRGTWRYFWSRCYAEGRSKAIVAKISGAQDGLATERAYTLRTLPRGVIAGLLAAARGDPGGLGRATAIAAGLTITSAGYLLGTVVLALRRDLSTAPEDRAVVPTVGPALVATADLGERAEAPAREPSGLEPPVQIVEVELSQPMPRIDRVPPLDDSMSGATAPRALIFARLHGAPLGILDVTIPESGLDPTATAAALGGRLHAEIDTHLRADGLEPGDLSAGGLGGPEPCLETLRAFAADAPPLTVVIPTRDRPERVASCVEAVLAAGHPRLEILVVDNGPSTDATERAIAERFGDRPEVRYVRTAQPGTARARNEGLRRASAEVVAFLDDDLLVDRDWLFAVARPFAQDHRVGCVTGMIVAAELETWPQLWIEEYGGFGKGFVRRTYDLASPPSDGGLFPYAAGRFGSGAAMAFRRSALMQVGGFDRALGGGTPARGGEDLAAFVDVILAGWRLVYEPRALVRHFHHREYERLRRVMLGYGSGLGAYLTRLAVRYPERMPDLIGRSARGVVYVLDPRSPKNARKRADYPAELSRLELLGLVAGPFLYARGRLAMRAARRDAASGRQQARGGKRRDR